MPDGNGNANAAQTKILYDVLGRQVAVIDANGNMNRQEWDAAGNLLVERHADGGDITYRYDVFGNKVQAVAKYNASVNGAYTTDYAYDRLNRLVTTTYAPVDASHYTVDTNGNYALVNDGTQLRLTETNTWDEAGRKTSHVGTDALSQATTYRYDLRGNVIQSVEAGITTQMAYDAQGRMTARRDGKAQEARWSYDYFGKLGGHIDIGGASYTYVYDNARQLIAQSNTRATDAYQMRQDLKYEYDRTGNLVKITDASTNTTQSFAYDLAGHRVRETTQSQGVTYRDNYLAYDALGRLKLVEDGRAQVIMDYDLVGNRTRIGTHVITAQAATAVGSQVEGRHDSEDYFRYDAMNRQVLANANADGTLGEDGHRITYDWLGNKTSDNWQGRVVSVTPSTSYTYTVYGPNNDTTYTYTTPAKYQEQLGETTESYSYDALGRLKTINRDGTPVETRSYDKAGRLTQSGASGLSDDYFSALYGAAAQSNQPLAGNGTELKRNAYDGFGRLMYQQVWNNAGAKQYELDYRAADKSKANYDAAGNLVSYQLRNIGQNYTNTYSYDYLQLEGYQEKAVKATRAGVPDTQSWKHYDGNGGLREANDAGQTGSYRWFVNDEAGRALYVNQGDHVQRELIVNGEVLGRYGEVVDETKPKTANAPSFTTVADFNFAFQPTAGNTPEMQERSHAVSAGDTLQGIAKSYYGDERLWYRIADANGVSGNDNLRPGQVLKVPALEVAGNAANTFRPYDPARVQGDSTPYMPAPKPKKKNFFKQLVAIVIAVVVAWVTQQWYLLNYALPEVATAAVLEGSTLTLTTTAAYAGTDLAIAGALGGAAGSVASQAALMAMGEQDRFSWKSVALSAVGGGIGRGLEGWSPLGGQASSIGNRIAQAATANALTQGIGVMTGLQKSFDWRGVAASAVGAGVGQAVGQTVGAAVGQTDWSPYAKEFVTRGAAGFAGGIAAAVAHGGKVAVQQIAANAFGNALGSSLAEANWGGSDQATISDPTRATGGAPRPEPYGYAAAGDDFVFTDNRGRPDRNVMYHTTPEAVSNLDGLGDVTPPRLIWPVPVDGNIAITAKSEAMTREDFRVYEIERMNAVGTGFGSDDSPGNFPNIFADIEEARQRMGPESSNGGGVAYDPMTGSPVGGGGWTNGWGQDDRVGRAAQWLITPFAPIKNFKDVGVAPALRTLSEMDALAKAPGTGFFTRMGAMLTAGHLGYAAGGVEGYVPDSPLGIGATALGVPAGLRTGLRAFRDVRAGGTSAEAAAALHPGRLAAESGDVSRASLIRALRQADTAESLATAKLMSRGKLDVKMLAQDPSGRGLGGLYRFGTREIEIYGSAFSTPAQAAGYATHEATHYMQGLSRTNYNLGHEFQAFRNQGAVDLGHWSRSLSDNGLYDLLGGHPAYRGVRPDPNWPW